MTTESSLPSRNEVFDLIFQGLTSSNAQARAQSGSELQAYLSDPDTPREDADMHWSEAHLRVFTLVHNGQSTEEKLGAILAIDHMLDVSNSHADLFRSYNHAKALLPDRLVSSRRVAIMCAAAATLGRIVALLGLTFGRHFMHPEVQSALARLGVDDWGERLAGVLVLHELAAHGREWFASHAGAVLDALVREGLERDPRMEVGEGATRVISVCRDVIEEQRKQEGEPVLPMARGASLVQPSMQDDVDS